MNQSADQNFDEMHKPDGSIREAYHGYNNWLSKQDASRMRRKGSEAESVFRRTGITFNVYGESDAEERLIPFDMIPRIITANEWRRLSRGIEQRVRALNAFMYDLYHRQEIIRSGRLPERLFRHNAAWLPQMVGFTPPGSIYTHITGVDLVRTGPDEFMVLEDNARTPSGVSYMLENRETMMAMFPELFTQVKVRQVSNYPRQLAKSLAACAPPCAEGKPTVAVLTPGIYNSAYFEHAFLADQMGAELVEGSDLRVIDGRVQMRTTRGYRPIDVLYRRVDDDFLDPLTFNPNSVLGIPGIMDVYRAGRVTIANAPGTGVADDKAIYSFMPEIVEFYTGEKPILANVQTWRCADPDSLKYVLENLAELVVKEVHGSGGYGMLIGPTSSKREIREFRAKLEAKPDNYIAQPTLSLSTCPVYTRKGLAPRHVDLRPFVLMSPEGVDITPGGLTRVAMKKGSLVVNSSQGGGTKDSWVLDD
ncbi:circularly permuted type 2 ATP-grasp protein [Altererythrobacter indicus]|uniref:Circularly permuted type 2 ATP-grasp protein n=1 Tax=Altericroceibacterium indicum TaxID=374177 RepID=A0A845A5B5_9SPHN|nr:circularly permuted type 2 ATP-grasp protein [Altericroceibacterium indicum]MXP24463.1 circularly permuted type 2 ATP-grasp protein [Altericroceibacterium indicum]